MLSELCEADQQQVGCWRCQRCSGLRIKCGFVHQTKECKQETTQSWVPQRCLLAFLNSHRVVLLSPLLATKLDSAIPTFYYFLCQEWLQRMVPAPSFTFPQILPFLWQTAHPHTQNSGIPSPQQVCFVNQSPTNSKRYHFPISLLAPCCVVQHCSCAPGCKPTPSFQPLTLAAVGLHGAMFARRHRSTAVPYAFVSSSHCQNPAAAPTFHELLWIAATAGLQQSTTWPRALWPHFPAPAWSLLHVAQQCLRETHDRKVPNIYNCIDDRSIEPKVGKHLQDHPVQPLTYHQYFPTKTCPLVPHLHVP